MGVYRLIAVMTFPLKNEGEAKEVEKKVKSKFKGIHAGASVYFRQDFVDDIKAKPDEVK